MFPHQRVAIEHPCRLAVETAHPRFARVAWVRGRYVTVVVTVNSGYE